MTATRWFRLAGTLIFVVCLIYLFHWAQRSWPAIQSMHIKCWPALGASVAIYAISHLSTALSWPLALRSLDEKILLSDGIRIGLLAQIGKYLPGNVAHYVGRAAIATRQGIAIRKSGMSTIVELSSALFASLAVAASALPFASEYLVRMPDISGVSVVTLGVVILTGAWFAIYSSRRGIKPTLIVAPTCCLAVSFALAAMSFYLLAFSTNQPVPFSLAIFAYVIAWGIGFVTPGAPAGLGVRETVLLLLLAPEVGQGPALSLAIGHRFVTAMTDGLAAAVGYLWTANQRNA